MRLKPRRISLSSSPFYASAAVVISLGVFMAIFWAFNEYEAYTESIENIRQSYDARYRERVREEVEKAIGFVEYRRSQAEQRIEDEIRDRVQSAYSIASHMFSRHKDEMPEEELKDLVIEVLRPIRWSDGRGYYFAGGVSSGIVDLYGDDPFYEGKSRFSPELQLVRDKFSDITEIVREKGAGMYRYNWTKPEAVGRVYPKISFVKYFEPFDWYIGAGIYLDDIEKVLQEDVLARIRNIRFGRDGEIFGFRFDGTIISHPNERLIGRSISTLGDEQKKSYGYRMLQISTSPEAQGFVSFAESDGFGDSSKNSTMLSFVKAYDSWKWVFVAAMSMDEMEKAIEKERMTYLRINFENITLFITLFIIAVSLMMLFAYFYSLRIRQGISLFTDFFRKAVDEKNRIDDTHLAFTEFQDLRFLANQMVDDLAQKELLIRRDELRLDTLLQLGMMDDQCFQDKYDFILERIVKITRSEGGYLALVNTLQTHVNIYSRYETHPAVAPLLHEVLGISLPVKNAGLPGAAMLEGKAVICNGHNPETEQIFPYSTAVARHLDVPIFNSGKIVLIAGVYNNTSDYDNTDVRQITMLLEGLWLHVLKMC
ncbi:MAG: cache domain-containing protein, partial [Desulfopila sp.]|nr:cache domain-containing protein [Desulfopila sp.]